MTDSLLRALVAWNRWLLARPAARATGLAPPAGLRCCSACRSRSFLERACHADRLVLGSSGSSRHWSRSALVSAVCACCTIFAVCAWCTIFAVCACCTTQSPGGSSVGLAPRWSPPLTSSVPLSPPRARIPLEFGCSRQFHTRGHLVLTVPRVQREEDQSEAGLLLRTHSAGPVSQTCYYLKGESCYAP